MAADRSPVGGLPVAWRLPLLVGGMLSLLAGLAAESGEPAAGHELAVRLHQERVDKVIGVRVEGRVGGAVRAQAAKVIAAHPA